MNSSKTLQTPDADSARRRRGRRTHARLLLGMLGAALLLQGTAGAAADEGAARFRDNGNGTVTDLATGLVWLQQANALGTNTWEEAVAACAKLAGGDVEGLADRSRAGQWRLPAAHEMLTLTKVGLLGGELSTNHPFAGLTARHQKRLFWTRTEGFHDSSRAFQVNLHGAGSVKPAEKSVHALAWPVKGKCRRLPRHTGRIPDLGATFARLTPSEKERAEINSLYDVQGLRLKREFTTLGTKEFLKRPDGFPKYPLGDFTIARRAPKLHVQILPDMEPQYFPEGEAYQAGWANWAAVTRSDDNRFVMGAGDHRGRGAQINLYVFDPAKGRPGRLERVASITETLGWTTNDYSDGKLHGHMDVLPDGTVWGATHHGPYPTEEWYAAGYRGSWLFSVNINSGIGTNWGVPLPRQSLPNHRLDTQRGILFASGALTNTVLCYDINTHRVRYAGPPPNGWQWGVRSTFLDPGTGHFWSAELSEEPYRFISYDPELNRFKRHDVEIPVYPGQKKQQTHGAWAAGPDREGRYYTDYGGVFIRFRPDWDKGPQIEVLGVTGRPEAFPVLQMVMSPDQRFVYWVPREDGTMIVNQYEIATGKRKILGFLQPALKRQYGLCCGDGVWGTNISNDGSFLVILDNGGFGKRFWGHPVLLILEIPRSER
jgi:hypothetical protein